MLLLETFLLVLCAAVAAVGYGSGLSTILRIEPNLGERGILGLLSFGFLGCLLNFLIPLSPAVQFAVLVGGVILAVIGRRGLRNQTVVWVAVGIAFIYVLTHHLSFLASDAGLYYLQTMRWIREYHVVPGLGNLHGRLAYNSMLFLIAGVDDRDGIGWISNLLMILFVLISLLVRLRVITRNGRQNGIEFWAIVLSILILCSENLFDPFSYAVLTADSFTAILIIYWTCVALGLSERSSNLQTDLAMLVLSAVLALTVKVSAAPLLLPTIALAWIHRERLSAAFTWRAASFSSLVLALWMIRGITLSGCVVYPVPLTRISTLPWAVSQQQVTSESRWIESWAREPGEFPSKVLKDRTWLSGWIRGTLHDRRILLFAVLAALGMIAVLFRRKFRERQARDLLVITSGFVGCLVFWFMTAPDPRFGAGYILGAAVLGGSIALDACFNQPRLAGYVPVLVVICMAIMSLRGFWQQKGDYFYQFPKVPLYEFPGTGDLSHLLSEVPAYELRAPDGTRIFVPKSSNRCWDHPVPCTPYFDPAALSRIRWPKDMPPAPPGWSPDKPVGVQKDLDGTPFQEITEHPSQ
jgi:hypothetical protein